MSRIALLPLLSALVGCSPFDDDAALHLLQFRGNQTARVARCSHYPHGYKMECGDGVALCGILALEMGTGDGHYKHPRAGVHGLWPQVPPYGNSQCLRPTMSSASPNELVSCYEPQSASESARHQAGMSKESQEQKGRLTLNRCLGFLAHCN